MSKFYYFACNWAIQPLTSSKIQELKKCLDRLDANADISVAGPIDGEVGEKIGIWILKLSTKESVQVFIDNIGNSLGLIEWHPTSEEVYLTGMSLSSANALANLVDATRAFGNFNRQILDNNDT